MTPTELVLLGAAVLAVAFLYSSVGQAGASGYIAVMSLFGLAPGVMKPTALTLNVLVAAIAAWQFWRAGHFSWALFWPFALLSVPFAFVGGYLTLPAAIFKAVVGAVLLFSAVGLLTRPTADDDRGAPARPVSLTLGAGIGLVSGLTGVGGGIFLAPILLYRRWARPGTVAAVSAVFILVNSLAALAGVASAAQPIPGFALVLVGAATAGGAAGSWLGSHRLSPGAIKRVLAVVLILAGAKLLLMR